MELKMILKGEYLRRNATIPDQNTLVAENGLSQKGLEFQSQRAKDLPQF